MWHRLFQSLMLTVIFVACAVGATVMVVLFYHYVIGATAGLVLSVVVAVAWVFYVCYQQTGKSQTHC